MASNPVTAPAGGWIADQRIEGANAIGSPAGAPVVVGSVDGSGNVLATSTANPLPLSVVAADLTGSGSVTSAIEVCRVALAGYYGVGVNVTSAGSTCTQVAEFSMDGGTTWTIANLYNINTGAVSQAITTTGQFAILIPGGTSHVRMRVSVYGSGTVTDQLRATAAGTGFSLVEMTDGTTVANVAPATGSQTGQAALQVAPTFQSQEFSFGSAVAGTAYDCASYRSVSVQFTGNASANTITFQVSNDNSNWVSITLYQVTNPITNAITFASATLQIMAGSLNARYFRLNCTNFVSGTTTGVIYFSTIPAPGYGSVIANQNGTWTVQAGNSPSGTALNTYSAHITTNTTNTPTASLAYISSISISVVTGGTTSTISVKDKSGTALFIVNVLPTTVASTTPTVINFTSPIKATGGIDIVTAGAAAATVDVFVSYFQ